MKSMTGYGISEVSTTMGDILVEARSENHRFLDLKIQLPDSFNGIENELIEIVKKNISRGKVKITISIENKKENIPDLNKEAGKKYLINLKKFIKEIGIKDEVKIDHVLMFKEIFNGDNKRILNKTTIRKIKKATSIALKSLEQSRASEGKKLKNDLSRRIKKCETLVRRIKKKRENFSKQSYKKLKEKIENLVEDKELDKARLYQEIALLTEKSDITEEIVRLEAHLTKFKETLNKENQIGKELDFLIQEMNRETSTISAKSKDANISHNTISLRSEFEKIREQIQNIE